MPKLTADATVSDMLWFVAVVQEGSFTRAAAKLGVTKQSVSDRVARLEGRLGVRLIERTTRSVRPTEVGSTYYERCSRIAAEVDEANQEARSRQAEPTGLLRVSAPFLFGRRFLAPVIAAYMRDHAGVRVDLVLGDQRARLIEEGFDLAIRVGKLDDSTLSARRIGSARVSTVAAPRFLRRHADLDARSLATVDTVGTRAEEEWLVLGRRCKVKPRLVANDLEIACAAAVAGVGIAHLPELVTVEHLEARRLRRVLEGEPLLVPVHAVYPSRTFLAAKVRVFIDRLVATNALS